MIRKIFKGIGIVLGSLAGLLALAFISLYIIGTIKWNHFREKDYDVPVEAISIPTDQASIARGERIATIQMCGHWHMKNLSGQTARVPSLVTLSVPNLTPGVGGMPLAVMFTINFEPANEGTKLHSLLHEKAAGLFRLMFPLQKYTLKKEAPNNFNKLNELLEVHAW